MNPFTRNITNLQDYTLQHIKLGQICGSQVLFRERYQVLRVLGRGGFGITFLAKDVILPGNPLCVIKQLYPRVTKPKSLQKACQRFEKEAKILSLLGSHSQIPMLIDYFESNGEFYLVQEYVHGHTLAREVRRNGRKNEKDVKEFLQEILPVLNYIHQNHVIHRDIKPQNLLRCQDDKRIVLIDFGAVKEKLVDTYGNSVNKSVSTNFIGTNGFAPPEQLSLRPVYASDIYALGITCIYLLTGKGPLDFEHNLRTGEICWQKEVSISDDFAEVLGKMVKVSLGGRFKSAKDVIMALGGGKNHANLSNCLTQQRPKNPTINSSEQSPLYTSPATRAAIAIRKLKARQNLFNSHHDFTPL
ncbi:serine/threonine protein kinase [Anabaena sp. UHCC 0253]|uniref:serine/threonine-protein kinase n=1 Tax=Anabaena sp. UHCC 0253 TaxID=2590019 RepID=UPI0014479F52|nr:serine/threonine-protein kinase [Anabaena sp. UHCC 0253]MTJ55306.1 serine/threonine protein kinase [Anabaena sp. UHCC 0253]